MTDDPISRMREEFIADASERVNELYGILASLGPDRQPSRDEIDRLFRAAHSLKGTAAMFDLALVSRVAASVESILETVRSGASALSPDMAELLLEAFDEMLLIFRSARGENVTLRTDDLVARIDAMVAPEGAAGSGGPEEARLESGEAEQEVFYLPGVLEHLSPEEAGALRALTDRGRPIYRIKLDSHGAGIPGGDESAIRRLQESGEVVAVIPETVRDGAGGYSLTIVYALEGPLEKLDAFSEEFGADSERLGAPRLSRRPAEGRTDADSEPETQNARDGESKKMAASPALTVKVDIRTLDSVMNTLSELYSVRLGLLGLAKRVPSTTETRRVRDDLLKLSLLLNKRVVELEESIIDARLEPISILFDRYRGEVGRLARRSGKKVRLNFEGEATRVDRAMLSRLYDPLLHIIRNAVDHGIETGPVREAAGKPEEGKLTLRARQEASHIRIDIEDDGSGIDSDRVRKVAREKGFGAGGDQGPLAAIFEAGISTKEDVTDISGRGVGLDAVKTRVETMRGMINVETSAGIGTRFSIWVPLTLAVSRGILLNEGDVPVVVPLASVMEVTALTRKAARDAQENGIMTHNGEQIQVVDLSRMLKTAQCPDVRSAVILGIGREKRALISERVCGETEIVGRPLPEAAQAPGYIAGASELHDGRPAIVIQPEELLRASVTGSGWGANRRTQARAGAAALHDDLGKGGTLRVLIFNSGSGYRGLPLRLLKEILPLKARTRLPVLGGQWLGLFFVRGLCHGLLSPEFNGHAESLVARSAAILESPERCGVAIGTAIGHFDIPLEGLRHVGHQERPGLVNPFAEFTWEGSDVTLLDAGGALSESLAHPAIP